MLIYSIEDDSEILCPLPLYFSRMLGFVLIHCDIAKKNLDFSFLLMIACNFVEVSVARCDLGIFGMHCDCILNELSLIGLL
jgi:hypothetical protein